MAQRTGKVAQPVAGKIRCGFPIQNDSEVPVRSLGDRKKRRTIIGTKGKQGRLPSWELGKDTQKPFRLRRTKHTSHSKGADIDDIISLKEKTRFLKS